MTTHAMNLKLINEDLTDQNLRFLVSDIYRLMSGQEWNADVLEEIAHTFRSNGITLLEPDDSEEAQK